MGTSYKRLVLIGFIVALIGVPVLSATFSSEDAGTVSDGVSYGAPDGMNVTIQGETDVIMETDVLFPDSQTVHLKTEAGNVSFQSSGPAWADIHKDNITGTWTYVDGIDATSYDITINPEDKRSLTVGKDIDSIKFRDATIDDGNTDFVYAGSSGSSKIVVRGLQANTQIGAVDTSTNELLGTTTTDSNGVATFSSLPNSEHTVALQTSDGGPSLDSGSMSPTGTVRYENVTLSLDVSDSDFPSDNVTLDWYVDGNVENTTYVTSSGTATATVGPFADGNYDWHVEATDEYGQTDTSDTKTFEIEHHTPQISNIKPNGLQNSEPSQISAQINDTDFAKDGDTLTVDFVLDGSTIDTQTIHSNQTVSTSMPSDGQTGGSHDIEIQVSDDWGNSNTGTESYSVPDTLSIRNELNHTELIPANGEVRFFGDNEVYSRTAPDGTVNMTGLPVNQDFIVEVEPTDSNFTTRTIYIESIYEQQSAYVLNTSAVSTVDARFELDDPTGEYGPETLLKIQKPIEINGGTKYQSIVADEFGVEGVTATLEEGQRYELLVAADGQEQTVGPYRGEVSETVAVEPGTPAVNLSFEDNEWAANAHLENTTLEFAYSDPQQATDKLTVWIHERGNQSNQLTGNKTYMDIGNASGIVTLNESEKNTEWVVRYIIERNDETLDKRVIVSNQQDVTPPTGANWTAMIGIAILILVAGAFSVLNAAIGAVVVSLVGGGLWYLGFLGGVTGAAGVVVALFVSVAGMVVGSRR